MKKPYETYTDWQSKFGKTFLIKALNGNVVVTSNPENIRRILTAKHDEISQFAVGTVQPLIGENSVLIVDGQRHKRARNLLMPPFRGEILRQTVGTMEKIAQRVVEDLQPADRIKAMDISLDYSLQVIIEVVFGVQSIDRVREFKIAVQSYVKSFRPIFAFTRFFQKRWYPPWIRFLQQKKSFNFLLEQQIAERSSTDHCHTDILSMLLDAQDDDGQPLSNEELKDHLITLLFAGHETTQIAIAWALSWLHRNPGVLQRFKSELAANDDMEFHLKSQLLDGICHEALRLNPIVADFLRVFKIPLELEEIQLPANSTVGIMTCLVHYDPEIYPHPQRFDPDRWAEKSYKPYEFLAFGGGVRRCIGAAMAVLEMKVALVSWLRRFDFELPGDAPDVEPVHRRNLTMAPTSGIELVVKSRG